VGAGELHELAIRQLADFDARAPNRLFARPVEMTIAEAYDLQAEVARLRQQRGERIIGYKVGCTSSAIQKQLGIHEPIFGRLFDSGCHAAGVRLSCADYANLAVEGELAVRLARDLPDEPLADEGYLAAIEVIFPVIELHHYHLCSARPCCRELIASNGMHAGVVLAEQSCPAPPQEVRYLSVRINDGEPAATTEPWTMGGPVASLRWLADRLRQVGLRLLTGQIVLTGSPMPLFPVVPGSRLVVEALPSGKSWADIEP
jgi:2-keto-4-pentenoate hydratase